MMPLWTASEAAAATQGRITRDWSATGVSIDSRDIKPGDLFIALSAARDGHDFVADALAKGAAASLVSRVPDGLPEEAPLLVVDDVQKALEALGAAARARVSGRIVAITGSAGKTSSKKMLADALAGQGRVHAADRSFNNHWGVPLTLARMPADTEFGVVEIGMNAPGEIAPLTKLARPHVAIVTTVAAAHLEAFGSLEGIAHEKAAIFEGLEPDGVAIFNGDLPTSNILRETAARFARASVTFGETPAADWRLALAEADATGTAVGIESPQGSLKIRLGTPGRHFAVNALAVLAAVDAVGADSTMAASNLDGWVPPDGRGQAARVALPNGGTALLVDDAFNANPASVAASLDLLSALQPDAGGRRVVFLGDMLELGPDEAELHEKIADHPALEQVSLVHCVGERMHHLWQALAGSKRGEWAKDAETMGERLGDLIAPGDIILVKGSKGSRVSLLVEYLQQAGETAA